jgi:Bax protein
MFFKFTFYMSNRIRFPAFLFLSLTLLVGFNSCDSYEPKPPLIVVREPSDILTVDTAVVMPVYYHNEYNFKMRPVKAKKARFIDMVLPPILMARHNFKVDRIRAGQVLFKLNEEAGVSSQDSLFMNRQMERLNASSWQDVSDRLATHPTSIVIAQAAVESGWGSSRFFREGNNLFGIWSFNEDEDRIAAAVGREDAEVYVRSYRTIAESVEDYFVTLARHNAYRAFREKRLQENDPRKLIYELHRYSELGYQYVNKLSVVMRQNNLEKFDEFHLDSAYVKQDGDLYF